MSVRVTIAQHPDNAFRRELLISRVSNLGLESTRENNRCDMVSRYEVEYAGGRTIGRTTFEHRYGDPVTVLLEKAIQALRSAGLEDKAMV